MCAKSICLLKIYAKQSLRLGELDKLVKLLLFFVNPKGLG